MEFTEDELIFIKKAKMKAKRLALVRVLGLIFLIACAILILRFLLIGGLNGEYSMSAILILTVLCTFTVSIQIDSGPKYMELVDLLVRKSSIKDPLIEVLKSKNASKT